MDNFVVDTRGRAVVDSAIPTPAVTPAVVGIHSPRVRMVHALPVPGVEIIRSLVTERTLRLLGDVSVTVVGSPRRYVHRMVYATPD